MKRAIDIVKNKISYCYSKGILMTDIDLDQLFIIKAALDKETPIKVTDIHVDEFYCPKCHSEISHDKYNSEHPKYCEECGQRLDWSDSE